MKHRSTEQSAGNQGLHHWTALELVQGILEQDRGIIRAVEKALPQIAALAEVYYQTLQRGGRIFYIGAGTSGRLGILDASELPPTYGVPFDWVIGLIAGGDGAIRKAVEFAEDDKKAAWNDLLNHGAKAGDLVVGIAASGTTTYVIGGLSMARAYGLTTACITCNTEAPILQESEFPVVVETGPEFVRGSTRMKAGTAQKMVLNMISTTAMIRLGRVEEDRMVDMQLSNKKLWERACTMVMESTGCSLELALELLKSEGSVRRAVDLWKQKHA